jgi:hypothetical protein
VWPDAARFVFRGAYLDALATTAMPKSRTATVLAELHSHCAAHYQHAFDTLLDECMEMHNLSPHESKWVWVWCCQELAGAEVVDAYFPDLALLAIKVRPPGSKGRFVDVLTCGLDIAYAVEKVRTFLEGVNLAPPAGHVGPWWLLQCSLAALLPETPTDRFAWWREDWERQKVALDHPPTPYHMEGPAVVVATAAVVPLGVAPDISLAFEPGEDPAHWRRRVVDEARRLEVALAGSARAAGVVKDPRPTLDPRPFAWAVLKRCAELSWRAIADEAGVTAQAVGQAVRQVEERVGLVS